MQGANHKQKEGKGDNVVDGAIVPEKGVCFADHTLDGGK